MYHHHGPAVPRQVRAHHRREGAPAARVAGGGRLVDGAGREDRRRRGGAGSHGRALQRLRAHGGGRRLPARRERLRPLLRRPEAAGAGGRQPEPGHAREGALLCGAAAPRRHGHQGRPQDGRKRARVARRGRRGPGAVCRGQRRGQRGRPGLSGRRHHHRRVHDVWVLGGQARGGAQLSLRIPHISRGGRLALQQGTMGTPGWKPRAANQPWMIGIGGPSSRLGLPCHTTWHAGPHQAVR